MVETFVIGKSTLVKRKGSVNSHTSTVQEQATINTILSGDLVAKMDKNLGVIQGYEGKTDTTIELMLDMQKNIGGETRGIERRK